VSDIIWIYDVIRTVTITDFSLDNNLTYAGCAAQKIVFYGFSSRHAVKIINFYIAV